MLDKLKTSTEEKSKTDLLISCGKLILQMIETGNENVITHLAGALNAPEKLPLNEVLEHPLLKTEVTYKAKLPDPSGILKLNTLMSAILERISKVQQVATPQQRGILDGLYNLCYLCGLNYQNLTEPDFTGTLGKLYKSSDLHTAIPIQAAIDLLREHQDGVRIKRESQNQAHLAL